MNNSNFRFKLPPVLLLYILTMIGFQAVAQSGKVFRDYNADGVKQATEPLIAGVIVKAYTAANAECATTTTTTVADGSGNNYSLTGCSGSVRVEFTIPTAVAAVCGLADNLDYAAYGGAGYGSSVQFTTSTGTANFAVGNPHQYASPTLTNPKIFTSCYVSGNNLGTGNVGDADAFIGVDYNPTGNTTPAPGHYANTRQIGSTWGVAYSKQAKRVFTSAVLKRHTGLGPLGSGGIYMIDPSKQLPDLTGVTEFLDFDAIGIPTRGTGTYAGDEVAGNVVTFSDVIGSNSDRKLGLNTNSSERDAQALAQVGRVSFGDLDLSDDGRYLYVMNLYDRKLYEIDLTDAANPVAPTSANKASKIKSWAIPEPCTAGTGEARPWGIDFYRGKPYIAVVCDAFTSQAQADLSFTIYELDPASGVFDSKFTSTMTYARGLANGFRGDGNTRKGWFAWTDDWSKLTGGVEDLTWPQPILSDIEFDTDGSMVLGFIDRAGLQGGWNNKSPKTGDNMLYRAIIGGDLLRAYKKTDCDWELESAGKEGPSSPKPATGGATNGEGPGGGEFYYEEFFASQHRETGLGGLGILFGSGDVVSTIYDPFRYDSFGLGWFDNTTGKKDKGFEVFFTGNNFQPSTSGTFSKGLTLGDVEIENDLPPLEIGNRIWKDTDKDGIQDAGEEGIDGVEIELYEGTSATGSPVQTKTSATLAGQKGSWYFTNLKANQDYVIKVKTALGAGALATCTAFSPTGAGTPLIDNNTSTGTITLKTGNAGENNHSFDIGVSEAPPVPKPGGWDFACEDGVMVETVGKSGFSVSNPTANCTGSGTATITLPNGTSADSIYIEAVYKASNPGPSITFKDAANNDYVAQRYTLPLGDGYVYRTKVPATASISLTDGTKFCALQSLVAYVFRKQAGMASTGVFTCEQGFQNTVTVNIPLPTLTKPADVTVCVPISELTNDGRLLQIKVTAGAIVKDTTITGSDPAFGTCCLAIPKLKLVDVPVGTTTVKVEIISPVSPAGQSFTVASAISANVQCEKCVAPIAAVSPKTQTVCVGGTATAFTATPSTGVEYKWYGPLTSVTASLGTAIAGQTAASFTPTGAALTTEGTKYYAVVVNTTGDATCADTAFVTLNVSKVTVPAATALCHANGTPEDASDDYMTFTIKVTDTPASLHTYTVTATQGGNPLAVTLSNGTPATAVNCGLNTPLRTPAGSAGKGNVTLTITNNVTGCSTTLTITDPGTCAVVCVSGTPSTVVYEYGTQVNITDLDKLPIVIPQFDQKGGTRVLQSVKLEYTLGGKTAFVFENRAAQSQTFEAEGTSEVTIELNGNNIDTVNISMPIPETTLPGGILVPASGTWLGDTLQANVPTTLGRMANWVSDYLSLCKDPRVDARWVTNATGDATDDDDMYVAQMVEGAESGSLTYNTTATLTPFIGTSLVPLNVSTLSGLSLAGGGGNISAIQRTRAFATAKVTYTYECVTLCTPPTRVVTATDPTCTTAGKIEITATNGDKYGVSKGATYTGPAYATATAVGTLPILIKGNISHAADSTWTIRVFNAANDCFKDTTVTVKALVKDATVSVINGFPVCRQNGTAYTIKFTKSPAGAVVTAKNVATGAAIPVTGDSVANVSLTVAKVRLIVTNGVCKDSVEVNAPVCDKPVGSIGDLIWKDTNDNGLQDLPTEKGVAGVKVNLYAAAAGTKTGSILQTKTTATDGLYLFSNLAAGDYIVEIDKTTLKDTCAITTKQNIPSDDTKDSDFNPTTGLSQVITLNPVFNPTTPTEILATNNLTVDAGLVKVCILPTRTVAATDPTCTTAGKIEITATNGDKYGVSKGATYTGPAYATATAVGTLPILIKGNISHAADSTWTIRVFNKDNTCFKDTTVTVKALVKDATVSVANGFPVCRQNGTAYTIKFTKSPTGAVVTAKNVATGAAIPVTGDSLANVPLTVAKVRLIVTNGVCKDSVEVNAPVCDKPVGSIGDLIWKDTNDNGLQDLPTEKGVAGVKVNLYAAAAGTKTGSILQTKTTGTDGLYLFSNLAAGDYIVEIDKTTLPDTCQITSKLNIPSDDTKDSDFNPNTGLSQVITLNPVFNPTTPSELLATNNLTVDAGLVVPCVKSKITLTAAPVCSADVQSYSLTFNVSDKVGMVKVNKGVLTGNNPYTVTGIPSGATLKITDSLSAVCKFDTLITGPNCNCTPPVPTLITPSLTACIGDTFPTLKATVVGLATVEWFATATSTTVLFTGLNFKPTGTVPATGATFYAQARSTDPACLAAISTGRIMATINAQICTVEVDLALKKSINTKIAQIGNILTYTLKVWNESNTNATGVEVTDSIATTVQFQTGSFTASRGSASITGNVIKWTVGGIAANGDTVTLTYQVKATQEGVHFNTAEISKTNEKDVDSTPGNGTDGEDDLDRQCFTVPIKLCPGEKAEANVPNTLTNVQWFKDGGSTAIATGNVVLLTEIGIYTFTATNQTCPANGCCPIIIEPGVNCCPEDLCIPFTIQKRKKK